MRIEITLSVRKNNGHRTNGFNPLVIETTLPQRLYFLSQNENGIKFVSENKTPSGH